MVTRRNFIKYTSLLAGSFLLGFNANKADSAVVTFSMPDESEPHRRTWMSFVANDYIWLQSQIAEVKSNLALIARTVAKYEPVSMLVDPSERSEAITLLGGLSTHNYPIELVELATDDLWLRDTGATFVRGSDGGKYGINFNFNGWGGKQEHFLDSQVANSMTTRAVATVKTTSLVLEGGCFEVDGQGTAILTRSCILNSNRNLGVSELDVENEMKALLGLRKIIWLDGIKGRDITDGHTDFYARFSQKGSVLVSRDNYAESYDYQVTRQNIDTLQNATDADGNKLNVTILNTPDTINTEFGEDDFAAGYIGYYVCNGAVIMPSFGDALADNNARDTMQAAFPNRAIEQIRIDGIASGGGSIHCATQQEPA